MTTAARGTWLRAAVLVLLLAAGVGAALVLDLPSVATVRSQVAGAGAPGVAVMVLAVALVLLAPVPRSAVSVLVGLVAGFATGVGVAFAGGLLAALAAFGFSRWLGRSAALRLAGPRLSRVDGLVADRGFVAVLAGRLLPVVPFVALSYGAGLTGVRLAPYGVATALGLVPSTVLQVGVGASVGFAVDPATTSLVLSLAALVVVAVGVGTLLWRRRRAAVPA
ncbi:hypothetical protein GCM10010531_43320 [Blastococcus jejuensis]|uniref:TVP38/TMEM64 family membrane protein n=1 Tax=Blastococcus jejuensis TaxID=351224 RepID=A0ABP6PNN6_9ACTN